MNKGRITYRWKVECAGCNATAEGEKLPSEHFMFNALSAAGWKYDYMRGWQCHACLKQTGEVITTPSQLSMFDLEGVTAC